VEVEKVNKNKGIVAVLAGSLFCLGLHILPAQANGLDLKGLKQKMKVTKKRMAERKKAHYPEQYEHDEQGGGWGEQVPEFEGVEIDPRTGKPIRPDEGDRDWNQDRDGDWDRHREDLEREGECYGEELKDETLGQRHRKDREKDKDRKKNEDSHDSSCSGGEGSSGPKVYEKRKDTEGTGDPKGMPGPNGRPSLN